MKLDINEIYHNYILKVVIFSLFLYKRNIRKPAIYNQLVLSFIRKRIPWDIKLNIYQNDKDKESERELFLNQLLNIENDNVDFDSFYTIYISLITPLKEVSMSINLNDEEKYEKYLYS